MSPERFNPKECRINNVKEAILFFTDPYPIPPASAVASLLREECVDGAQYMEYYNTRYELVRISEFLACIWENTATSYTWSDRNLMPQLPLRLPSSLNGIQLLFNNQVELDGLGTRLSYVFEAAPLCAPSYKSLVNLHNSRPFDFSLNPPQP